ncbi:hypothetical protein FRC00_003622 [Tulasnella sp. 408]|nr:hypothetical protein FRC00_003622 [Tulasnella sp. 408]
MDVLNTPNLEYLSLVDVNGGIGASTLPPFPVSPAGMARLRYLHLDRVSVRWDGITTPLLSTLILENMPTLGPSLSQLFDILSTCTRLATLHINNVNLGRVYLPNPVSLPHLRNVTLISTPTNVVECIMYFLHGPPYPSETREGLPQHRPESPSINNVSFTTANRVVLDTSRIVIKKDLNSIRFTSDGRCKLELDMVDTWAVRGMLLWFHNATKSCNEKMPPVRLEWNDQGHNSDIDDVRPLATFSYITYLKVGKYNNWSISIVQYLSGTSDLDFESPAWPFGGLQELYLEFPRHALVRSLAQMITARQQSSDHVDTPTPLRRIILGDEDEATLEERFDCVWPEPLQNVLSIANSTGTQILWYGSEVRQDGTLVSVQ